jgi:thymidylate synthase (FAD)
VKVTLLASTPEPEKTVALAARLCYSPSTIAELEEKIRDKPLEKFLGKILKMGHLSVLEHASFTFGVDGISRVTSHQLVRHRLASFSQQSQRYVKFSSPEYVVPETIAGDEKLRGSYTAAIDGVFKLYKDLVDSGVPAEDARFVLPNAACTRIIITMNARELLHFFKLRCCERAQWEIRAMATEMLKLARQRAPFIFRDSGPACVTGPCSEGEMTCARPVEIRARFKTL